MSLEVPLEMRERAYRICCDYLNGAWNHISQHDMLLKQISGGLSNLLYYCALPPSQPPLQGEPSEVLLRIYGQVHGEGALQSILAESVIFTVLSERHLGPKLLGIFPGGRLEEFIPARSLTTAELSDPELSSLIARKMALMHSLNVPISKEPSWLWNSMQRWLCSSLKFLSSGSSSASESSSPVIRRLREFQYERELEFMKKMVEKMESPVVFGHNDVQEGNILLNPAAKKKEDRVCLIDFEYCAYNYRGFDIANHFCEWIYEYKSSINPYYSVDRSKFPNIQEQIRFLFAYCKSFEEATGNVPFTLPSLNEESFRSTQVLNNVPDLNEVFLEIKVFTLVSHLFWGLWSIVQSHVSAIQFGYLDYALTRMDHYTEDKEKFLTENAEFFEGFAI